MWKKKPDIIALSETRLNSKHVFSIENYIIIRTDRLNNEGGGTAIVVRREIPHTIIKLNATKTIETTIIKIKFENKNLFIISTYIPPKPSIKIHSDLNIIFNSLKLNEVNNFYILIGDLNARHHTLGDSTVKNNGIELTNWIDINEINFKIHPVIAAEATFTRSNAFLDLALGDCRIKLLNKKLETHEYDSDHKAISIKMNFKHALSDDQTTLNNAPILFKKTNWKKFQHKLKANYNTIIPDNRNLSNEEIDTYIDELQLTIKKTIDEVSPRLKPQTTTHKYINNKLNKLYKTKKRIQTNIHRLISINNINNQLKIIDLKNEMKLIKNEIKLEFNKSTKSY